MKIVIGCDHAGFGLKNLVIDNMRANTQSENQLFAPENGYMENVRLSNMNIHFKNKPIELTEKVLEERGEHMLNAKGVKNLELRNIRFTVEPGEENTWGEKFHIEDCEGAIIENCR